MSISAAATFDRVFNRPMFLVLVFPFGIRTRTVHPSSWGIYPVCHMCGTMYTRYRHHSLFVGVCECSLGYASNCN